MLEDLAVGAQHRIPYVHVLVNKWIREMQDKRRPSGGKPIGRVSRL